MLWPGLASERCSGEKPSTFTRHSLRRAKEEAVDPQLWQRDEVALLCSLWGLHLDDGMPDLLNHDALAREGRLLGKVAIENDVLLLVCEAEGGDGRVVRDLLGR